MPRLRRNQQNILHTVLSDCISNSESQGLHHYTLQYGTYHLAQINKANQLYQLAHNSSFLDEQFRISQHHSWSFMSFRYALATLVKRTDLESELFHLAHQATLFTEETKGHIPEQLEYFRNHPEEIGITLERLSMLDDVSFFRACVLLVWIDICREDTPFETVQDNLQQIEAEIESRFLETQCLQWEQIIAPELMVHWTLKCAEKELNVHKFLICTYGSDKFVSSLLSEGLYLPQNAFNLLLQMVFEIQKVTVKRSSKNMIRSMSQKSVPKWEERHAGANHEKVTIAQPFQQLNAPQITHTQVLDILEKAAESNRLFLAQTYLNKCIKEEHWTALWQICTTLKPKKALWQYISRVVVQHDCEAPLVEFLLAKSQTSSILRDIVLSLYQNDQWNSALSLAKRIPSGVQACYTFRQLLSQHIDVDNAQAHNLLSEIVDPYQRSMAQIEILARLSPTSEEYKPLSRTLFTFAKNAEGEQQLYLLAHLTAIFHLHQERKAYNNVGKLLNKLPSGRMAYRSWIQIIEVFTQRGCLELAHKILSSKLKAAEQRTAQDSMLLKLVEFRNYDAFFNLCSSNSLVLDECIQRLVQQKEVHLAIQVLRYIRGLTRKIFFIRTLIQTLFETHVLSELKGQQWNNSFRTAAERAAWKLEMAKYWLTIEDDATAKSLLQSILSEDWPTLEQNEDIVFCTHILSVLSKLDMEPRAQRLMQRMLNPKEERRRLKMWRWSQLLPRLSLSQPVELIESHLSQLSPNVRRSTIRNLGSNHFKNGQLEKGLVYFNQVTSHSDKEMLILQLIPLLQQRNLLNTLESHTTDHPNETDLLLYSKWRMQIDQGEIQDAHEQYTALLSSERRFEIQTRLMHYFEAHSMMEPLESLLNQIEADFRKRVSYHNVIARLIHRYLQDNDHSSLQRIIKAHQPYLSMSWFTQQMLMAHIQHRDIDVVLSFIQDERHSVHIPNILHTVLFGLCKKVSGDPNAKRQLLDFVLGIVDQSPKQIEVFTILMVFYTEQRDIYFSNIVEAIRDIGHLLHEQDAWGDVVRTISRVDFDWALELTRDLTLKQQIRANDVLYILYRDGTASQKNSVLSLLHQMSFGETFYTDFFKVYLSKCWNWQHIKLALLYTPFSVSNANQIVFQAVQYLLSNDREEEGMKLLSENPFFQ